MMYLRDLSVRDEMIKKQGVFYRAFGSDLQRMDDTWDVTEECEQDVDKEITADATLEENTKRWEEDGADDLADIPKAQFWSVCFF